MIVNLSQVLKTKLDADKTVIYPEPCKGCSHWRGSICYEVNGTDPCRHIVDWLNNDFPSKSKF